MITHPVYVGSSLNEVFVGYLNFKWDFAVFYYIRRSRVLMWSYTALIILPYRFWLFSKRMFTVHVHKDVNLLLNFSVGKDWKLIKRQVALNSVCCCEYSCRAGYAKMIVNNVWITALPVFMSEVMFAWVKI
jgi:hypothetical protein